MEQVDERQRPIGYSFEHPQRVAVMQADVGEWRVRPAIAADMDEGLGDPVDEWLGTDHAVYLRHALSVMRRHTESFEWLVEGPRSWQVRPGGWPETRYERKARTVYGHEVWYFRFRRR